MIRENVRKRDEKEKRKMLEKRERETVREFSQEEGTFRIRGRGLNSVTANEEDGELKSKGTAWVRRDTRTFADHFEQGANFEILARYSQ